MGEPLAGFYGKNKRLDFRTGGYLAKARVTSGYSWECPAGIQNLMHLIVQIIRMTDPSFPGWVECLFHDAFAQEHRVIDKVAIFTEQALNENDVYPRSGEIACQMVREWRDETGCERCLINTLHPDGIQALNGETQFDVFRHQLRPPPSALKMRPSPQTSALKHSAAVTGAPVTAPSPQG